MTEAPDQTHAPIAIVGIGCLFPRADGLTSFWRNVKERVDAITEVPPSHWRPEDYHHPDPKAPDRVYTFRGGFLDPIPFNPGDYGIAPRDLEAIDTSQLLGLVVAQQALADAGYGPNGGRSFDRRRTAVILGVTGTLELVIPLGARLGHPLWRRALREAGVADQVADDVVQRIADSYVPWQENSFPGLLGNVVAGRIANRLDLGGTNCVVDAACASSLSAVHLACLELLTRRADMVLTGGVDTFNDIFMFTCFSKTPALSPTGDARPFDAGGDGTILGEGLGMLVLKRLDDARRDGDRIYAVIRGLGTSSDGKGNAVYAPRAEGQVAALRQAYQLSGVSPATVELVEAHGTGTRVGDATEVSALAEVYRESGRAGSWCSIGSIKSQIGHTKAAAGVAGLIKAAAALYYKVLPPTIKVREPLDLLQSGRSPLQLNVEKRPWLASAEHPRRAGVSAFGFGGSNFHCVLEEAEPEKTAIDWDGSVEILAFAADSVEQLQAQLTKGKSSFRPDAPCRLVLVRQRQDGDPQRLLQTARDLLDKHRDRPTWSSPEGIFFGSSPVAGRLAILFPGQGAQYVGMLRDLSCQMPALHRTLNEANRDSGLEPRLSDRIYPPAGFRPEERQTQEEALRATEIAQPALGAVSLGAFRVLEQFGVRPDALLGHSYGELVALCAAGRMTATDLFRLSRLRGRLMAEAGAPGDKGSMLAVFAGPEAICAVLRDEAIELSLANKNAPKQTVLSGPTALIERAASAFERRQVRTTRLSVAAAFHSSLVAAAREPFRSALESVPFPPGAIPVIANSTGLPYPDDPAQARELLAGQLARPVEFVAAVEYLYGSGCRAFLEVGPGARLTGLVRSILADRDHQALALDSSSGQRSTHDLACCLAWLASLGHNVRLLEWEPASPPSQGGTVVGKPALTVMLTGANYVRPRERRPATVSPSARGVLAAETAPPTNGANGLPMNGSHSPSASPTPPAPATPALGQALQITRESLLALQKLQEQTAQLHRQFLEGQEAAQRTLQVLVEQQQRLLQQACGVGQIPEYEPEASATVPNKVPVADASGSLQEVDPPRVPMPLPEPPPAPGGVARITQILRTVISEKTGYPAEMLELDMALDSDLGIDSIKRVEILSVLQERLPDAPAVKPEHLGVLHSLRHIVAFLAGQGPNASPPDNGEPQPPGPGTPKEQSSRPADAMEKITAVLVEIVSEKTGYPAEMLELDMALDSDLGIDSIKRVEILSALQERLPDAPQVKSEHLGSLHSLRQIAAFLTGKDSNGAASAPPAKPHKPEAQAPGPVPAIAPAITASLERSVLRAVPLEGGDRPTRRLPEGAEVWITEDDTGLAELIEMRLRGLGYRTRLLTYQALPSQERPAQLGALVLPSPRHGLTDALIRDALLGVQRAAAGLRAFGKQSGAVLLSVSRLDGAFGLKGDRSEREPLDAALAGLVKTAAQEWPEVACKAIDLTDDFPSTLAAALAVVEEMFRVGPVEVGLSASGLCVLERRVQPLAALDSSPVLHPDDVVVISGGARGVTAAVAEALARFSRPHLVLLGRTELPTTEPDWLAALSSETEVKRELARRSPGLSPRAVGEQYQQIASQREVRQNLVRLEATGASVQYRSVDIRDAAAVAELLGSLQRELGPIRGLIHGAGVLADARIEDKTAEQFDRVWSTKVQGLRSLLEAVTPEELRLLVLFSSSSARLGRIGQSDYAMANEVLNKRAQQLTRQLPACRVLSINWGPWDGGMVTPALKRLFEQEGIGVIPLPAGAEFLLKEIQASGEREVEVMVLAESKSRPALPSRLDGEAQARLRAGAQLAKGEPAYVSLPTAFERRVGVDDHPILGSHVLDGRPVVPVALILEWLAHAALVHNPGLAFHGCNDLRILHGLPIEEEPPRLRFGAGKAVRRDGSYLVPVELSSSRGAGKDVLNARAEMVLADSLPAAPAALACPPLQPLGLSVEEIYRDRLFHGPELHGIQRVEGLDDQGLAAWARSAPAPASWMQQPLRQRWLADPLVIDVALQLLVLWSIEQRQAPALPCRIGRYRQYRRSFPPGAQRLVVRVSRAAAHSFVSDVDVQDEAGQVVARLEDCECTVDSGLVRAFRRNRHGSLLTQAMKL